MFGGGGNPRKMQQMMEQMGIDLDELDATSVTIDLADGTTLVFDDPEVTRMDARGQQTYQVVGDADEREGRAESEAEVDTGDGDDEIPQGDVDIVVQRTDASEREARDALEATDGDLAAAVERLE